MDRDQPLISKDQPITAWGSTRTLREWAEYLGVSPAGIRSRIYKKGMTPHEAVTKPWAAHAGKRKRGARPSAEPILPDLHVPWEESDWSWYVVAHHPNGLTLDEIGQLMGITRERVRQIEQKAFGKLLRNKEAREVLRDLLDASLEREVTAPRWNLLEEDGRRDHWTRHARHDHLKAGKEKADPKDKVTVDGKTLTIEQWSKRLGISVQAILMRIGGGWTKEEAVSHPRGSRPPRLWSKKGPMR